MFNLFHTLIDGLILSALVSGVLIVTLWINPRLYLQDYPKAIQEQVEPKTSREKRLGLIMGIPFLALLTAVPLWSTIRLERGGVETFWMLGLNAFGVVFIFNLVDWLVLDWLMFCRLTPRFLVIPGTEGSPAYKDYLFHFRAFLVGTILSVAAGLVLAALVWLF